MKKKQIIEDAVRSCNYAGMLYPSAFDGRKGVFKRALEYVTREELARARLVYNARQTRRQFKPVAWDLSRRRLFLQMIKQAEFDPSATSSRYNLTGVDWCAYHRPSSNGVGWVLIAPDEPANNWYCEDNLLVDYLRKKFESSH